MREKEVRRQTQVMAGKCDRNKEGTTKPENFTTEIFLMRQRRNCESAIN